MKRKFLAFTGGRSDYDLMSGVYAAIHQSSDMELGLVVSGSHLEQKYGQTIQQINSDGLNVLCQVRSLTSSDLPSARAEAAGLILQQAAKAVEQYKPDALLFPGDREEVLAAATIGAYLHIPSVHFYGGDHATDGHVDNSIRHATSKLSSIHMVAAATHQERLIALGEDPKRIHLVGSPALDRFHSTTRIAKEDLLRKLGQPSWNDYAIVIFHPSDLESHKMAGIEFENILKSLENMKVNAFVSAPNSDAGNFAILSVIEKWKHHPQFSFYKNLDRVEFVNLLRNAKLLIGNSSAGLYEAPSIPLAVVNVGNRQRGRLAAENVIYVDSQPEAIASGIEKAISKDFQSRLADVKNPYGDGKTIPRVMSLLRSLNFKDYLLKTEDPLR